jgi:xylose isomerase
LENKVIAGKSLKDHLRFASAYRHTFCGTGEDPLGPGTQVFPLDTGENSIERAKKKMDVAFEFLTKIGA